MKVSPSGHISGKGYGRDGFIDEASWRKYRNRKNAEGARYNSREKAKQEAAKIQSEINTKRMPRREVEFKQNQAAHLLSQAEATRLVDRAGKAIPGRTVQSVEQAMNNLNMNLSAQAAAREAQKRFVNEVMQRFSETKVMLERDIQMTKSMDRFNRNEIDIIMQQTQHIWENEQDPNKRFDAIMEYFAERGETNLIEVFGKILVKAREQANIMDVKEFIHLMNTSGEFDDKQRERFMRVMALDNADVVTEYLMIEYTSTGVYDISDVVL